MQLGSPVLAVPVSHGSHGYSRYRPIQLGVTDADLFNGMNSFAISQQKQIEHVPQFLLATPANKFGEPARLLVLMSFFLFHGGLPHVYVANWDRMGN